MSGLFKQSRKKMEKGPKVIITNNFHSHKETNQKEFSTNKDPSSTYIRQIALTAK